MCGISGFYSPRKNVSVDNYYRSHSRLQHRGPDDEGLIWHIKNKTVPCRGDGSISSFSQLPHIKSLGMAELVLGHYRLSILDTSNVGHQPMYFDGLWLSYNGEVYNYLELKIDLESKGYTFETGTDTEVVLKALHCWGKKAVNRFNGMWAFALFNTKTDKLLLCRDRFGIKPLYYAMVDENFFFASEAKFFKGLFPLSINEDRANDYLNYCWVDHHEETMLDPIRQLMPSHWMELDCKSGLTNITQYWELKVSKELKTDLDSAVIEFNELFNSSLDLRMRSDVPVGALLSGGLDSTSIVCNLQKRKEFNSEGFHTFSAVFSEKKFSERPFIEATLDYCEGLKHHWVSYGIDDVLKEFKNLVYIQDFPLRSLAVFSQMKLYDKIAQGGQVSVLLNGQGADEIFGGYTNHFAPRIISAMQRGSFHECLDEINGYKSSRNVSYKMISKQIISVILERYFPFVKGVIGKRNTVAGSRKYDKDYFNGQLLQNLLQVNLPEYLRYEDRNSMAYSKESRLPFLDYRLVEWAFQLAPQLKINKGITKYIQRVSVKPYTTPDVVSSTMKMGFVSPQQEQEWTDKLNKYFIEQNGQVESLVSSENFSRNIPLKQKDSNYMFRSNVLQLWRKEWLNE